MASRGVQNLNYSQCKCINIDLTNTRPQRVFSSVQTWGLLVVFIGSPRSLLLSAPCLGNRSVFILDLRLESTPACGLLDFPTPACCFNRIHCSKLWRTEVTNNVFTSQVQRSLESNIPSYMKAYYWSIEPVLFCFLAFDMGEWQP